MVPEKGSDTLSRVPPGVTICDSRQRISTLQSSAEWRLNRSVFLAVMNLYGPCKVHLFASRLNFQHPHYISWRPDQYTVATDAFRVQSMDVQAYAFPPFALIGRCLQKMRQEGSTVVLIAPVWPSQSWYPWHLGPGYAGPPSSPSSGICCTALSTGITLRLSRDSYS